MQLHVSRMADQEEYASADELDEELERAFEAPPRHVSGAEKSKKEQQSSIFTTNSSWGDGVTQHSGLQTKQKALGLDPSLSSVAYSLDDPPTSGRIDQSTGAGDIRLEKESAAQAQENKARGTLRSISKAAGSNTKDVTINAFSRQLARQSNDLGEGSFDLWTHGTSTSSLSGASAPTKPEITFQFPDWGVNFGKAGLDLPAGRSLLQDARLQIEGAAVQSGGWDAKEGNGSAITATEANGKGKGNPTELASSRSKGRLLRPEEDPSLPASFCVFHTLPEEVLLIIFKKLAAVKDVCSCILVCNKWEESLSGDEIWAGLLARQIPGRKFAAGGAKVEYKRGVMIRSVGYRFQFLRKVSV